MTPLLTPSRDLSHLPEYYSMNLGQNSLRVQRKGEEWFFNIPQTKVPSRACPAPSQTSLSFSAV